MVFIAFQKIKYVMPKTVSLFFRDADKVLIGDDVLVYGNDELSSEKVTNVSSFAMDGKIFTTMKIWKYNVKHHPVFLPWMTAWQLIFRWNLNWWKGFNVLGVGPFGLFEARYNLDYI